MTQTTYVQNTAQAKSTAMDELLNRLGAAVDRVRYFTDGIENFGHKISNTNYPPQESVGAKISAIHQTEGVLSNLEQKINSLEMLTARLEETGKKLSELI